MFSELDREEDNGAHNTKHDITGNSSPFGFLGFALFAVTSRRIKRIIFLHHTRAGISVWRGSNVASASIRHLAQLAHRTRVRSSAHCVRLRRIRVALVYVCTIRSLVSTSARLRHRAYFDQGRVSVRSPIRGFDVHPAKYGTSWAVRRSERHVSTNTQQNRQQNRHTYKFGVTPTNPKQVVTHLHCIRPFLWHRTANNVHSCPQGNHLGTAL